MLSYFHGRTACPATPSWNILKTLLQTAVFWAVFLFLLPWAIVTLEDLAGLGWWRFGCPAAWWAGGLLFLLASALGLTSGVVMAWRGRGTPLPTDCPRELVVSGPYRYIRNPMAVSGLTQGVAVGVVLGSPAVIFYALLGGPVWHLLVRRWEEADLERRFGEPYRRYRREVRCWVPRFPGYQSIPALDSSSLPRYDNHTK